MAAFRVSTSVGPFLNGQRRRLKSVLRNTLMRKTSRHCVNSRKGAPALSLSREKNGHRIPAWALLRCD